MRAAPPKELEAGELAVHLAEGWGLDVRALDYAPLGFGSYHWITTDQDGVCGFVTVDDLEQKPWLGDTHEASFDGLRRAFDTAVALRRAGLDFVVAPIPTVDGASLRRITPRFTIALLPFVEGETSPFGVHDPPERPAIVELIAELHRATPAAESVARRIDLHLPGRRWLERALGELDQPWSGGPYSEPARQALADHASDVSELLALLDRLAGAVAKRSGDWVVTHGEPHAGNVMRTGQSRLLVDWDTVALAPPERDLWMLVGDTEEEASLYADATGREPDEVALDFFRLTWDLADMAAFTHMLRSPHSDTKDTTQAYNGLAHYVKTRNQWAALLD